MENLLIAVPLLSEFGLSHSPPLWCFYLQQRQKGPIRGMVGE